MRFLSTIQKAFLIVLAVPAAICGLPAQTNPTAVVWGIEVNGLQISATTNTSAESQSSAPALTLVVRNIGSSNLHVVLGGGCGVPRNDLSNIGLVLMDSTGASKRLKYTGPLPYQWFCAGVGWINEIALAPKRSFSIALNFDDYKSFSTAPGNGFEAGWQPGETYLVRAELLGVANHADTPLSAKGQWEYWEGKATSNQVDVHFPAP
jgi:hypothetical protein